jgi:hypothetical protein
MTVTAVTAIARGNPARGDPARGDPARGDPERGSVTVEAAIALCALVFVFGLVLAGFGAVADQLRCTDAAAQAARLVARGQPGEAERVVAALAPRGARLSVRTDAETVSAEVLAEPGGLLPGLRLRGTAAALREPDAGARDAPG